MMNDHTVTDLYVRNPLTKFRNDAAGLVPADVQFSVLRLLGTSRGRSPVWIQVAAADARSLHCNDYLAWAWPGVGVFGRLDLLFAGQSYCKHREVSHPASTMPAEARAINFSAIV